MSHAPLRYPKFIAAAFLVLLQFYGHLLWAEQLMIVNRTGADIELIQGAAAGSDTWSRDLIAASVVRSGESAWIDVQGPSPYALRLLDSDGTVYVLYDVTPGSPGKVVVGPEHQARLAAFAGEERTIRLTNQTGFTISSIRLSSTSDKNWGDNLLEGRIIRNTEVAILDITAVPGTLSFDLRFSLRTPNGEAIYEKSSLVLTDGASLVLSIPGSP